MTFKNRQPATKLSLLSLGAVAALSLNAQAAVIANGGFDDYTGTPANGDLISSLTPADWSVTGTSDDQVQLKTTGGGMSPQDGGYYLGIFTPSNGVAQTFDTVNGQEYEVTFYLGRQGTDTPTVDLNVDGSASLHDSSILINSTQDTWAQHTISFTADSLSTTLSFVENASSASGTSDVFVDTVSITAVPEPSSAALLGLGGLALILRRRK